MKIISPIIDAIEAYVVYVKDFHKARARSRDLHRKIKIADERFRGTGKKHYVIPDTNGKYTVVNRKDVAYLQKHGHIHPAVTMIDILKIAVYSTPDKITAGLTAKIYGI